MLSSLELIVSAQTYTIVAFAKTELKISFVCGRLNSTFIQTANCPPLLFSVAHCIRILAPGLWIWLAVCDFRYRIRYEYKILIQKPEEKKTLGRSRREREDIRLDIKEMR